MHHCRCDGDRSLHDTMLGNRCPWRKVCAYLEHIHGVIIDKLLIDHFLENSSGAIIAQFSELFQELAGYVALLDEAVRQASFELIADWKG